MEMLETANLMGLRVAYACRSSGLSLGPEQNMLTLVRIPLWRTLQNAGKAMMTFAGHSQHVVAARIRIEGMLVLGMRSWLYKAMLMVDMCIARNKHGEKACRSASRCTLQLLPRGYDLRNRTNIISHSWIWQSNLA